MKKMTDDEIMAKALLCPESEKVPLEVGDRVIALETFKYTWDTIDKGSRGVVDEVRGINKQGGFPARISWNGRSSLYGPYNEDMRPIGKLVKRGR